MYSDILADEKVKLSLIAVMEYLESILAERKAMEKINIVDVLQPEVCPMLDGHGIVEMRQ